jgi:methionyl-tRNA synthetase
MATPENAGAIGKAVRLTKRATVVTDESITPSGALKVGHARRFVREQSLEFWKRARERQVVSLKHVDNHGYHILE